MNVIKVMVILMALGQIHAAEQPFAKGVRGVQWNAGIDQVVKAFPKALGVIKTSKGSSVYIVDGSLAYIIREKRVVGVIAGDILGNPIREALGIASEWGAKKPIGDGFKLGMEFDEVIELVKPEDTIKPDYRATIQKGDITYKMTFIKHMDSNAKTTKWQLGTIIITSGSGADGDDGGIDPKDLLKEF